MLCSRAGADEALTRTRTVIGELDYVRLFNSYSIRFSWSLG